MSSDSIQNYHPRGRTGQTMGDNIVPKPSPNLNLPPGNICCDISIIDTTTDLVCATNSLLQPNIKGHELLNLPTYAFYIKNQRTGIEVMFDLGSRKDWWNTAPVVAQAIMNTVPGVRVKYGVDEILKAGGVRLENISAVILSHSHWDHIGDVSKFGPQTTLVVGPGFKEAFLPGYPKQNDGTVLQTDVEGRQIDEIDFSKAPMIGQFRAVDYFGDGSLYILDVPGHAVGHISCLVRDTPTTFIFLGGDVTHFGGAFRPSPYIPMPSEIPSSTILDPIFPPLCPCSVFTSSHPLVSNAPSVSENPEVISAARTTPFYSPSTAEGSWYFDSVTAGNSISKLIEFDASTDVLVLLAHDPDCAKYFEFFPHGSLNSWKERKSQDGKILGKEGVHWAWLNELPTEGRSGRNLLVEGRLRRGGDQGAY